ncbi:10 kDa heat shock protein [Coelomomyces lativittatus]|nr:10 kDa heat shock protein [Coelomomyces lativittatus]
MSSISNAAKRIVPLLDRVLLQKIKPTERTASGLFIPESGRSASNEALVVAVGPGQMDKNGKTIPVNVVAGDRVILPEYGGSCVKVGEEEFHIFRSSDIIAKVNP